jgi:hypothetical protein
MKPICSILPAVLCALAFTASSATAAEAVHELGRFGAIPVWLIVKAPDVPLEKDPFEAVGGEAKMAAMVDEKLVPLGGNPFEVPDGKGGKLRIGDGVWEAVKMVLPEMPGVWNEYPRLVVPEGYRFAYCRLDSPADMKANLLTGLSRNGGKCRIFLNGKEAGTVIGGSGWETKQELPIELKKGANHLLVRFQLGSNFACRLLGENSAPLREVKARIASPAPRMVWKETPPVALPENQKFSTLAKQMPPLAAPKNAEFMGIHLGRTMALLESGKFTQRPVRIVFDGQSIEAGWTDLFIRNLRERYPDTKIVAENRAIGGWFVWRMQKLLKHDILRWQPDLVLFSAYQGTAEVWERLLAELRAETTADIVIRTQHFSGNDKLDGPVENPETLTLRSLAAKYEVELVEVTREWREYLVANQMEVRSLLSDGIHLNQKGDTLMALLYDRHFKYHPAAKGWAATVRRFDVGSFVEDHQRDGIVLEGNGWTRRERFAKSNSADDKLRLKFKGTRVDLVLPAGHGRANVFIDGKKPSELNLFHGTRPQGRTMADTDSKLRPNGPMAYHTGANMQEETWTLTLTHGNVSTEPKKANVTVKFSLSGSKTGFDGEGSSDASFTSKSGRITILKSDWHTEVAPLKPGEAAPELTAFEKPVQYTWHIVQDGMDTIPLGPGGVSTDHYMGQAYDYLTVADGLPLGVHELTLVPIPDANPNNAFLFLGVDIHRPPLARDAEELTQKP